MIASISGKRMATGLDWVVIDVAGIGMKLLVTPNTVSDLLARHSDDTVTLQTILIVREDALTLYGFLTNAERDTFDVFLSVSGIGPRTALAALSVLTPSELAGAIQGEDLTTLQRIPGVGKKSAQRIILELSGKLAQLESADVAEAAPSTTKIRVEVESALEQLGWSKAIATSTIDHLEADYADASSLLRAALVSLGSSRG